MMLFSTSDTFGSSRSNVLCTFFACKVFEFLSLRRFMHIVQLSLLFLADGSIWIFSSISVFLAKYTHVWFEEYGFSAQTWSGHWLCMYPDMVWRKQLWRSDMVWALALHVLRQGLGRIVLALGHGLGIGFACPHDKVWGE